jgi:hypothetical protein
VIEGMTDITSPPTETFRQQYRFADFPPGVRPDLGHPLAGADVHAVDVTPVCDPGFVNSSGGVEDLVEPDGGLGRNPAVDGRLDPRGVLLPLQDHARDEDDEDRQGHQQGRPSVEEPIEFVEIHRFASVSHLCTERLFIDQSPGD